VSIEEPVVFPSVDPVGPGTDCAIPNRGVVAEAVASGAARADAEGVRRETLDALADAGLLGTALDPPAAQRELGELLAGSDATTWFTWVQHHSPLRILEGSADGLVSGAPAALTDDLLPRMRTGRALAAVAFAHVRRPGTPNPVATRVPGGWRLDGVLDWVTSWDIADVVMVMAQGSGADADRLVCCYLPAGASPERTPGVSPGAVLELLAMSGTHTRPVRLEGVHVPDERVGAVLDRAAWLAADGVRTADASPSAFGVARGAIAELHLLAEGRDDDTMRGLVASLVQECRSVRAAAYAAADEGASAADRLGLRAVSLDLAARAATGVVIARSGAAMRRGCSAERRLRESMFLQVQAQTAATRQASLSLMRTRTLVEPDVQ
jgi:alkylation response protein AidB-like acyl-CoA dehydrogenase